MIKPNKIMKKRNIIILLIIFFVTLGLYGFFDKSIRNKNEKSTEMQKIKIEDSNSENNLDQFDYITVEDFNNEDWINGDPLRIEVNKLLPKNVFFRDLEKIPNTNEYLGIYVKNYSINEQKELEIIGSDILTICPEQIYGQSSVDGEYHLFLYKNNKIIDDIIIPQSDNYPNNFVLNNAKRNNFWYYDGEKPLIEDENKIERTKLLKFADYTGDGLKHEISIVGVYLSCGHEERMIVGYNDKSDKIIIYPIRTIVTEDTTVQAHNWENVYWYDNFEPDNNGVVNVVWGCGDHGNDVFTKDVYIYDKVIQIYKLTDRILRECLLEEMDANL